MKLHKRRKHVAMYLIAMLAVTAICWDIAVSSLDVQPGTFRYESEFDALTAATSHSGYCDF